MTAKYILLIFSFFCISCAVSAQEISFKDTAAAYNSQRLHTNKRGMEVLGGWGIANMVGGGIGYFAAKQDEWKYFHEMNFFWGAINTGIAGMGLHGVRKEMAAKMNIHQSYDRYKDTKKLYLINAGLDVLYIGTGVALAAYSQNTIKDKDIFKGFGRSIAVQGVFLLLFDNVMFASHQSRNSKWYRLMNEVQVTGNGVGLIHNF